MQIVGNNVSRYSVSHVNSELEASMSRRCAQFDREALVRLAERVADLTSVLGGQRDAEARSSLKEAYRVAFCEREAILARFNQELVGLGEAPIQPSPCLRTASPAEIAEAERRLEAEVIAAHNDNRLCAHTRNYLGMIVSRLQRTMIQPVV